MSPIATEEITLRTLQHMLNKARKNKRSTSITLCGLSLRVPVVAVHLATSFANTYRLCTPRCWTHMVDNLFVAGLWPVAEHNRVAIINLAERFRWLREGKEEDGFFHPEEDGEILRTFFHLEVVCPQLVEQDAEGTPLAQHLFGEYLNHSFSRARLETLVKHNAQNVIAEITALHMIIAFVFIYSSHAFDCSQGNINLVEQTACIGGTDVNTQLIGYYPPA